MSAIALPSFSFEPALQGLKDFFSGTALRPSRKSVQKPAGRRAAKPAQINRFEKVIERIKKDPRYHTQCTAAAPYGTFRGRALIGETGPINGGVYLGAAPHEAVVVDERYGLLTKAYEEFTLRYAREHGGAKQKLESGVMRTIVDFIAEKIPYLSDDQLGQAIDKHAGPLSPDKKIALDVYLKHRAGTARHQVLLGAYLLEKLKSKGLIAGNWYLDPRCRDPRTDKERLIYSSASGDLFVFTPGARGEAPR